MLTAILFTWLQGADFYRDVHAAAVAALPPGDGALWVDMGCGPGLVARLAAARGYRAVGLDRGRWMVALARLQARRHGSGATYRRGDLAGLAPGSAAVVSACSLLAVLDDRTAGLARLWSAVRPGGTLLLVEPTATLNPAAAAALQARLPGRRRAALGLWARARAGRAVAPALFDGLPAVARGRLDLLDGLVAAWWFRKGDPTAVP